MTIRQAIFCAFILPGFVHAEGKVAVIDLQKAVLATADGKKMQQTLESEFTKAGAELAKMEQAIRNKNDELEKKYSLLSDAAKAKMQQELAGQMHRYQESLAKSQGDLQKRQSELARPIVTKIDKLIAAIAKRRGYALVIERSPLVHFYESELDVTDEIIRQYEAG